MQTRTKATALITMMLLAGCSDDSTGTATDASSELSADASTQDAPSVDGDRSDVNASEAGPDAVDDTADDAVDDTADDTADDAVDDTPDTPQPDAPTSDEPTVDGTTDDVPSLDTPTLDTPTLDTPTLDTPTLDTPAPDVPPPPLCGNGVVNAGETCDTGIAAGRPGACPTSCDDMMACTADTLVGAGTCAAACSHAAITRPASGDGCCPPGANATNDSDCRAMCGNGVLEAGEACDTMIAAGRPGACPTVASCNDAMACTADSVTAAGTCDATCAHAAITRPAAGDGCCPPGATAATDTDCRGVCGNGVVEPGEQCDTMIAAGRPGACPTVASCNDAMACTADALVNAASCAAACTHTAITRPANSDGCCPSGANATNDNDCRPVCGNSVVETGETCDTGLAAGRPGTCPTVASCNDSMACTADSLTAAGTCTAACAHTAITRPANSDGCCPAGANATNDNDCRAVCGNSVVEPGETCDTGLAAGRPGACPTVASCNDAMACTVDSVTGAGTCAAACAHAAITVPANGDGCCPSGANANNDNDCRPVCGNRVVEAGETCDDGNTRAGDGCGATCLIERTAFRMNTLTLRDPHAFVTIFGCNDITDTVNSQFTNAVTTDATMPPDGLLDLSVVNVFTPLNPAAATTPFQLTFPNCTAPIGSTRCTLPTGAMVISATATNRASGACMALVAGSTRASYSPAITIPSGPCYSAALGNVSFNIAGILIPLQNAQVGATYSGTPASQLVNGLVYGFLSVAAAQAVILPATLPIVGGRPLASILAGGPGNCRTGANSDIDTLAAVQGWWVYLNFTAVPVPYS